MASEQRISGMSTRKAKATWTHTFHKIFVELCLEQTIKGNRPCTHFTKEGWRNIVESFHRKVGVRYDRKQLKNHWDVTKEQWKIWCKLIGTSSMKWDSASHKFGASNEDWDNYLQANPEAAHFRYKELPFTEELETIFDGTAVSGETEPPTQRRKKNDGLATAISPMNEQGIFKPDGKIRRHFDAVESRSVITVQSAQCKQNYSIGECIECLDRMEEVEEGSELYLFALDIFLKKEYREIFLQLKKPSVRIAWLQRLQSVCPPLH
ncbi:L10-interacting MYB domain-containing protein [Vitis riparia]|uniref:L10-interacting MYB domain-containing protein n=1 Tax=Vitis riparia TaxID=96939 RepID=UPI00155B102D|nr:L10-interacting MYB domain-containing protein [Vitis riparia]